MDTTGRWFYPNPGRKEAEGMLLNEGQDGSFLVRSSQHYPGDFTLCVRRGRAIGHFRIQTGGGGSSLGAYYELGRKFATLDSLLQFHTANPGQLSDNGTVFELKHPLYEDVAKERWYHGALTDRDAELLLTEKGQDGSYLVRTADHSPGNFVLSIRVGDDYISHVIIRRKDKVFDLGGGPQFHSLLDLVEHYKKYPFVEPNGRVVTLKSPFYSTLLVKVDKAVLDSKQAISNHRSSSSLSDDFLQFWLPQTGTVQVFAVHWGTPEFSDVERKFFSSMTRQYVIRCIERIQNQWLWEKYVQHRSMMKKKNSGEVNEMELFHGTRHTDPRAIYDSEEGFDMRFSAQGMWGQANYFAADARYSHGYAYSSNDGNKSMFLAKVLTGDSFRCTTSDTSLRMPPPKSFAAGVQLGHVQYDTVTGFTKGSRVYMTYDNHKAYPAYLITYYRKAVS